MAKRLKVDASRAWDIANEIRAGGFRPSIRTVRARLIGEGEVGGSHRALQGILAAWREAHGLCESEADTGVPPEFQSRIDALTTALWDTAHRKAAVELSKEQERSKVLDARLTATEEANRALMVENDRLREQIDELDQKQDRRAREFWDRVLIGVGEMLKKTGPLSSAEIFEKLPPEVRREWLYHVEPIRPSTITKKLKERGGRERYVVPDGNRWKHLPPTDEAKGSKRRTHSPVKL